MQLFLLQAALAATAVAYYDTVLEKKCMGLKRVQENAAYVNGYCFVAMTAETKTTYANWMDLHTQCTKLIVSYKGQLAYLPDKSILKDVFASGIIKASGKYFVGARQYPVPECKDTGLKCSGDGQKQNWKWFDEKNNLLGNLDTQLFNDDEPGNQDWPETIAVLESTDSYQGGLNDFNPEKGQPRQSLCMITDYLKCEDGYYLIRDKCYKIYTEEKDASGARSQCVNDRGSLASIHDDSMNAIIIDYARYHAGSAVTKSIRFGLSYSNSWKNADGSSADFFRWWDQAGCGNPTSFTSGGTSAALSVSDLAMKPMASYWEVVRDTEALPFLCQRSPVKAYDLPTIN